MRKLLLPLLLLLLASCAHKNYDLVSNVQDVDCKPDQPCYGLELPEQPSTFKAMGLVATEEPATEETPNAVVVGETKGFRTDELKKLERSLKLTEKTVASQCYEDYLLSSDMIQTNGKTRGQVLSDMRTKSKVVNLEMYYKNNGTVGYTYPSSTWIWMNRKFHSNYTDCTSAGNLKHEWTHKIGYGHDYKRTARRPRSVPYLQNSAFKICCVDDLEAEDPIYDPEESKPEVKCYFRWWKFWGRFQTCYKQ